MTILCPTCGGRCKIPDPKLVGKIMGYSGPNGESCFLIICQTCAGTGWVENGD
jgi:hypothetical protein